jgi:hypothetical protein
MEKKDKCPLCYVGSYPFTHFESLDDKGWILFQS